MTAKKLIDVERLMEWTYRLQKAHLVVDHGVGLHAIEARAAGIQRSENSTLAAVERYGLLGCFVDGGGYAAGAIHADAEAVHDFVRRMADRSRWLLLKHGKQASRPEWGEHLAPTVRPIWKDRPVYDADGHPAARKFEIVYRSNRPVWCPVRFIDHTAFATRLREDYAAWHAGLTALATHCSYHPLTSHLVTGPSAPAAPWEAGQQA